MNDKIENLKEEVKDVWGKNKDAIIGVGTIIGVFAVGLGIGHVHGLVKGIKQTDELYSESYRDLVNRVPYDRWYR